MKCMKDTEPLEYTSERHRQVMIDVFSRACNGGYVQITDDYLESKSLQKGIILMPRKSEADEAILTHCIEVEE